MINSAPLKYLADLDARIYATFGRLEERLGLYRVARIFSFTGDGYLYILIAAIALAMSQEAGQALLVTGCLAFAIELPLYFVLKKFFKRRRPYDVVLSFEKIHRPSDEFSFPSGHTTAGFMMAYLVSHFFAWALVPMYIWATLIGLSRVILRVHFVSDIVAGVLLGSALAYVSLAMVGH